MTKGHRRCQLIVKKEKNDKLRLTFNMLPWPNEMKAPKLLLTSCDADYCNLADMLKLETGKKSHFINHSKAESIIFNEASYGWHNKNTIFISGRNSASGTPRKALPAVAPQTAGDKAIRPSVAFCFNQFSGRRQAL